MELSLTRIRLLATLISALAAPAAMANPCATPYASGIGGTGIDGGMGGTGNVADAGMGGTGIDGSGMGGTGTPAVGGMGGTGATASGGIGGTGRSADNSGIGGTGVVGVITGFASICVNGVEIHYDGSTPVTQDGRASSTQTLAIGQWVSVEAAGHGASLQARSIALNSALVGPVARVAADGKSFEALGQVVRIDQAGSPFRLPDQSLPKPGQMVRVSGLRDAAGVVHATRLETVAADTPLSVSGPLTRANDGTARIGALYLSGVDPSIQGTEIRVTGALQGGVLRADRVDIEPDLRFSEKVDRLLLQGLAHRPDAQKAISLGYARLDSPKSIGASGIKDGQWVRVEAGRNGAGGLDARRLLDDHGREEVERQGRAGRERHEDRDVTDAHPSHDAGQSEMKQGLRPERHELEKPELEKPEVEKPELEKPEVEKPELEKPEVEKPELEKPEYEKPEYEKPEIEKPEYEKPELERD